MRTYSLYGNNFSTRSLIVHAACCPLFNSLYLLLLLLQLFKTNYAFCERVCARMCAFVST